MVIFSDEPFKLGHVFILITRNSLKQRFDSVVGIGLILILILSILNITLKSDNNEYLEYLPVWLGEAGVGKQT